MNAEDIVWVLTVPVCCSHAAMEFMRYTAVEAGLIKSGGQDDEVNTL